MLHNLLLVILLLTSQCYAQPTNYYDLSNWAAHPLKADNADQVPTDLKKFEKESNSKKANVFFIHPTTYTQTNEWKINWNAKVEDTALNNKTDNSSILFQASCFNYETYVYAPRYRQAHYHAFFTKDNNGKIALDTAYADVKNAFLHFLKTADTSLPFIIAAHSQGTMHGARLIKELIENKPLQQKMIVAYLIGLPVYKNYFSTLPACTNAVATNCFASWRSYLQGFEGEQYILNEQPNSIYVTNPLSWQMDTAFVSKKNNKGAVLLKFNKILKHVSGAQVHNNILWISKPKFKFSFLVKNKLINYHVADINMFYVNIRTNLKERIDAFYNKTIL